MGKNVKGGSRHTKAKKYSAPGNERIVMRDESCNEHYAYVCRARTVMDNLVCTLSNQIMKVRLV